MNMSDDVVREAEKIGEEGYSARTLTGFTYRLFLCIGLVMALFHIYFLGYSSLEPWILYYTHLGFGLALAYLLYPFSAKSNASRPGAADIGLIVLSVAACAYFIISMNEIVFRIGVSPTPLDLVFSSLVILLVLEMTRRTNGLVLPLIAVLFILYGLYGNILPYSFGGHRGYSFSRLISYLVGMDAMLSTPLATVPEATDSGLEKALYELFGMERMLDKHIILLSSGELRKFQLTKTLLSNPRVLIMDNPFIGLDAKTRDLLHTLLGELTKVTHLQVILILSKSDDIPAFITHVIPVEDRVCGKKMTLQEYLAVRKPIPERMLSEEKEARILNLPYGGDLYHTEHVVDLNKVSIRYGERTILKDLDWTVKCGEKWALSGENGSGKSTLLSLVCADNPQSYACDITLFGRKRGSGESIWEIKKHIGYVSPEMHRAYLKNLPAIDIVASGLHDSVGLYKRPRPEQMAACEWWMDIFGIANLKDRNFLQLSSGEQRLVLLARAFVKDPELLILDEPLHGLDLYNRRLVKDVIETFCRRKDKTMIMVTHYQEELPACITNSLFLKRN